MEKRGQVTTFVILGVIIVALILIFLYARQTILLPPTKENLDIEMDSIKKHINDCTISISENPIRVIGLQGGYLETPEDTYRLYNDSRISYLCYSIEDSPTCYNRLLLLNHMEEELQQELESGLKGCLDLKSFERFRNFNVITTKDPEVDINIQQTKILVNIDYPVTLKSKRDALEIREDKFTSSLDYPLGELYDAAQEILSAESQIGDMDILSYMIFKKGKYKIYKEKPYPDKIYILKREDNPYIFQFAVQGQPSK
ncbi:hypothetical protein HYX17_00075 [Candidatus Woesearchaeota archaeon]|nr:hypothetical protein [Candidatus Woesearchaeota archaeon]